MIPLGEWRAAARPFSWREHVVMTWEAGDPRADVLLLIHGFPTASWDWCKLWPALQTRWRVLTLDMIGFGFSAKPPRYPYAIADQADLLEAWLRECTVQRYHVLAHDYGDTVAQELLARQREAGERPAMQSLCLLNGGLFPEAHSPLLIQKLLRSPLGPLVARLVNRRGFGANLRRIFGSGTPPSSQELDGFWTLINTNDGRRIMPRLIRYMAERRRHRSRWVGALQHAAIPLRLVDGTSDPISGAQLVRRYRELIPAPDVIELTGIGHYPQVEAGAAVLDAYLDFRATRVPT